MDLKTYLNEKKLLVEDRLLRSVADGTVPETLRRAMTYSLEAGGKRLRPVLAIASAEAIGGEAKEVMNAAVALEMIHTFSLIHDDLPAMDDDSLRRGKPTSHKVFGEAVAILAGDALLAEAFSILVRDSGDTNPRLLLEVVRDIADATGGRGMTGGQVTDIESTGKKITEKELTKLHRYKTGALLKVACTAGAKLCGANIDELRALSKYGEAIGLAFQIADDILDIEGDESVIGKDVGSDEAKGKNTYPSVIGLEAAKRRAAALVDEAITAIAHLDEGAEPLRQIAKYIVERKK